MVHILKIHTKFRVVSPSFLWKPKSWSGSGFNFGFQYQNNIVYIEDGHKNLLKSSNSFKSYCVLGRDLQTNRHTYRQTDSRFFLLVLSSKTYKTRTFNERRELFFNLAIRIHSKLDICRVSSLPSLNQGNPWTSRNLNAESRTNECERDTTHSATAPTSLPSSPSSSNSADRPHKWR